jgi:hypothetical protein
VPAPIEALVGEDVAFDIGIADARNAVPRIS